MEPLAAAELIVLLKFPRPGKVKTRLIPALGEQRACRLYEQLVQATLSQSRQCEMLRADSVVACVADGPDDEAIQNWLGAGVRFCHQGSGSLGDRMCQAFARAQAHHAKSVVMIGADCPGLTHTHLKRAFLALQTKDVVIGPAADGGYYLIGTSRFLPQLFEGIDWSTSRVLEQTLAIIRRSGLSCELLEPLHDLDRPEDLAHWAQTRFAQHLGQGTTSVIIPCLNEEERLGQTLAAAQSRDGHEIIVVDGGSQDRSRETARSAHAILLETAAGRASQMNAGAAIATGEFLCFVHADTILPPDYQSWVKAVLHRPGVAAGAFRFQIRERFAGRSLVEWGTNWRARLLQLPYGDQGLFMRRETFIAQGGFRDLPLMEDYEFVWRLRRKGRIAIAPAAATTSGRRWQRLGWFRTTLTNSAIVLAYHAGVAPSRLAAWYRRPGNTPGTHEDPTPPLKTSLLSNPVPISTRLDDSASRKTRDSQNHKSPPPTL